MAKSKFTALLYLLLVFLSGAMVGGFAYRLYMVNTVLSSSANPGPRRHDPEEFRRRYVSDIRAKVKLDDQQVAALQQILDQTRAEFHRVRDKMNAEGQIIQNGQVAKIKAILRPDQQPLYDQFRAEREAERKRRQAERK